MVRIEPSLTGTIDGDENTERGNWSRQLDFLFSCLGYAVGLGNVWRFPYLSYTNGGGAFFIPYFIMLVFIGMPVFFVELGLGQFSSRGPIGAFKFSPVFQGAAMGMVLVSAIVCTFYGVIISWAFFYLFSSFTDELPWASCDQPWNTEFCSLKTPDMKAEDCLNNTTDFEMGFCSNSLGQRIGIWNDSLAQETGFKRVLPASEYYKRRVLNEGDGIEDIGTVSWELSLCLLGTWILVYMSLYKGVKSSGKVVYFTTLFPYAILIVLFFRGITLPGAGKGIYYYITPRWEHLATAKVWRDAAGQIFFSLSTCFGGLITLSSYNRFRNNILSDAVIVSCGNCATSVFAGFVIYSYIGNLAHELKTDVDKVSQDGAGLAFVIYPMALLQLPGSPFWAILFFVMLITLGLDTQFTLIETVSTTVLDRFPRFLKHKPRVILVACTLFFFPGLLFVTRGGNYWLKMIDTYASSWNIIIICVVEINAVAYVYGYKRFAKDVRVMTGRYPPLFWRICLQGLSQGILMFVLIFDWYNFESLEYGSYKYPFWADAIGLAISVVVVLPIPITACYKIISSSKIGFRNKLIDACKPSIDWGPALPRFRMLIDYVPDWDRVSAELEGHLISEQTGVPVADGSLPLINQQSLKNVAQDNKKDNETVINN